MLPLNTTGLGSGYFLCGINAALIASNARENRMAKLRSFWEEVTSNEVRRFFQQYRSDSDALSLRNIRLNAARFRERAPT